MNKIRSLICFGLLVCCLYLGCNSPDKGQARDQDQPVETISELPNVLEIIGVFDLYKADSLFTVLSYELPDITIYRWQDHFFVSGDFDLKAVESQVLETFQNVDIKFYQDPFYNFHRAIHCDSGKMSDQWNTYLLSSRLVAEPGMQAEYIRYHKVQFSEWPGVARGFCNAEFQQLLVYRNERRLLILISVPEGKSLEELNPKTSENNPQVEEWNKLMSRYQVALPDAPENEVWIEGSLLNY